MFIKDRGNSN